jgi:hypothetical protein
MLRPIHNVGDSSGGTKLAAVGRFASEHGANVQVGLRLGLCHHLLLKEHKILIDLDFSHPPCWHILPVSFEHPRDAAVLMSAANMALELKIKQKMGGVLHFIPFNWGQTFDFEADRSL